ncbi:MAG: TolC family protein [Chryseobacterium sp.]|nr:TolC family protein [Chryseobacterium sp.]
MRFKPYFLLLLFPAAFFSQQKLSLEQCEALFLKNNLLLLAEQYTISAQDAEIVQAKIWDLPEFTFETNAYNPEQSKAFDVGSYKSASLQQLFQLGGKRQKEVDFLRSNKELALLDYTQLVADLRAELRSTFFSVYFDEKTLENISRQLGYFNELLKSYKNLTNKGIISLKDEVRIQSIVFALNNDKMLLNNALVEMQQKFKLLTGLAENIQPVLTDESLDAAFRARMLFSEETIQKAVLENNAEYLKSMQQIESSKKWESFQKSLNIPDLRGGVQWNQDGGAFKNEVNVSVGIPIPLWKQNKGNVQKAKILTAQTEKNSAYKKLELLSKASAAFQTWNNLSEQFQSISTQDIDDLETVYQGMLTNFRKGNVSLLEFTDFTDSYKENVIRINEIKKQLLMAQEELYRLMQTQK